MRSAGAVLLALALAWSAAGAAPLCRDAKGLYTPCPPSPANRSRGGMLAAPRAIDRDAPPQVDRPPARPHAPRRMLLDKGRLCRDSKGLATPCVR